MANLLTLNTSNARNETMKNVVAIDLGSCRFATIVTTNAKVEFIESNTLKNYCEQIEKGESSEGIMDFWLVAKLKKLVQKWKENGVEGVYVGCCNGNFSALCGKNEEHPFNRYRLFEKFVSGLEKYCKEEGIYIDSTTFDESYTSKANSLNSDYVPSLRERDFPAFTGERCMGNYVIDKNMLINTDVNAALNILHKAGFNVTISTDSNIFDFVTLTESGGVA